MNIFEFDFNLPGGKQAPVLLLGSGTEFHSITVVNRLLQILGPRELHVITKYPIFETFALPNLFIHTYPEECLEVTLADLAPQSINQLKNKDFSLGIYLERPNSAWFYYENIFNILKELKIRPCYRVLHDFQFLDFPLNWTEPTPIGARVLRTLPLLQPGERQFLYELARTRKVPGNVVEIGTYAGGSAIIISFGLLDGPEGLVYTFDFTPHPQLEANFRSHGVADMIRFLPMNANDAAPNWELYSSGEKGISMLWIDGDHSYKGCRDDINAWERHLLPGGTICFHDYHDSTPGIIQAISEGIVQSGRFENFRLVDSLFAATKIRN